MPLRALSALLPLLSLALAWHLGRRWLADPRDRLLAALLLLGTWLLLASEGLSLCHRLDAAGVVWLWALTTAALGAAALAGRGRTRPSSSAAARSEQIARAEQAAGGWSGFARWPAAERTLAGASIAVLAALLVVALWAPPNTYDSMSYHMTRVIHWIQEGSLAHFPTSNLRQIEYPPFAELCILHLQLLSGGDRLANLPQWLAMLASVAGVSRLAGLLGAAGTGQLVAAVLCLTLPMGAIQATSTQNDYVAALWCLCLAWALLQLRDAPSPAAPGGGPPPRTGARRGEWPWVPAAAASLGLGIATKPTAYLIAAPFGLWLLVVLVRRFHAATWQPIAAAVLVVLALDAGHFARNTALFGSPLGARADRGLMANEAWGPRLLLSNVVRNLAVHANVSWIEVRGPVDRAVRRLHEAIGLSVDDPRITYPRSPRFRLLTRPTHDDEAGNGFHLLVFGLAMVLLLPFRRPAAGPAGSGLPDPAGSSGEPGRPSLPRGSGLLGRSGGATGPVQLYAAAVLAGFLLFCFVLRWQVWASRLQLPLFVVASPAAGAALAAGLGRRKALALALALLVLVLPAVACNETRPLLGGGSVLTADRTALMFANRPELLGPYGRLAAAVHAGGCRRIGLVTGYNDYEYPFWVMVEGGVHRTFRFEHQEVTNESARLAEREPFRGFHPCLAVSLRAIGSPPGRLAVDGQAILLGRRRRLRPAPVPVPPLNQVGSTELPH